MKAQPTLDDALQLHRHGDLKKAQVIYKSLVKTNPSNFDALHLLGVVALQSGNFKEAASLIEKAIALNPNMPVFYYNRGMALKELKQLEAAVSSYDRAITLRPDYADAYINRGVALKELKQLETAVASYDRAISLRPSSAEAYGNRGNVLLELGQMEAAIASYDKAIQLDPGYAEAYSNRGNALLELKRFEEAVQSHARAIEIAPNYAEAYTNRGNALSALKRLDEAVKDHDRALAIKPNLAEAHANRGNVLSDLRQFQDALLSYDRAIHLKPKLAGVYKNKGNALLEIRRLEAALACYDQAINLRPDYAEAHLARGSVLFKLKRLEEAVESFEQAVKLDPEIPFGKGDLLHAKMQACDWNGLKELFESIYSDVENSRTSTMPFGYQGICSDEHNLKLCAEIYSNVKYPPSNFQFPQVLHRNDKIKVAYLCGEFREQATSILLTQLWELHDKSKFEIIALDNGWDDNSPRRKRIESAFDELVDISQTSDMDVARLINQKQIDILVNLNGFFGLSRQGVFACKPAKVQVNYLGFPGTIGAAYMDYLIADKTVIPEGSRQHYTEKVVYMPHCYQPNDKEREISDKSFTREECGLPKEGVVFCCFNNNYKITPEVFDSWARILDAVEGSVLWLLEGNSAASNNLIKAAERKGIDPDRIVFARMMNLPDHLARHRLADLFLDTLPYNAHTTASDALWAGLPVLTCLGSAFPGRVAASLLKAIDLPELITTSLAEYEALAIELGNDHSKLESIKRKLDLNRLSTALFDTEEYAKHIEDLYVDMLGRYHLSLEADSLQ